MGIDDKRREAVQEVSKRTGEEEGRETSVVLLGEEEKEGGE